MTNKYYYLVSQLPYLRFNSDPVISVERFLAECSKWLTSRDMLLVQSSIITCPGSACDGIKLLSEWREFDGNLRGEIAKAREAKKQGSEYKTEKNIKDILSKENPLEAEKAFEEERWNFLEDKKLEYFFDLNFLILYYLELQILKRVSVFNKDKGETYFYELCEVNYEGAIR